MPIIMHIPATNSLLLLSSSERLSEYVPVGTDRALSLASPRIVVDVKKHRLARSNTNPSFNFLLFGNKYMVEYAREKLKRKKNALDKLTIMTFICFISSLSIFFQVQTKSYYEHFED